MALVFFLCIASATTGVNLLFPVPDAATNMNVTGFSFSFISDISLDMNCSLIVDGVNVSGAYNETTLNGTSTSLSYVVAESGRHTWSISCANGSDMSDAALTSNFTIDASPPEIFPFFPSDHYNTTNANPQFSWSAGDALLSSDISCNFTIDGAVNRTGISFANGSTCQTNATDAFTQGRHTWSATCSDALNNTAASEARTFTFDTTAPAISIQSPANFYNTTNANPTFSWTATDAFFSISCNLTIDGAFSRTVAAGNNTPTTITAVANFTAGMHNWSVSCWDSLNNTNSSATSAFTVEAVPEQNVQVPAEQPPAAQQQQVPIVPPPVKNSGILSTVFTGVMILAAIVAVGLVVYFFTIKSKRRGL